MTCDDRPWIQTVHEVAVDVDVVHPEHPPAIWTRNDGLGGERDRRILVDSKKTNYCLEIGEHSEER